MLELNEKLIRKGKAVGLPYVGSKKKISKKIVEIIKQNFGTDKTVYDVFGGGGAITAELMINNMEVVYNDLDKTITDMFNRVLLQDREWIKTLIVSRNDFFIILAKDNKTVDDELKLLVNSFGNDRKSYLYSKNISDIKYKLAVDIIKKDDVFSGYKNTTTYQKNDYKEIDKNDRLQQLQRLQQLVNLQQLEQLPKTTNEDFRYFSEIKDSILYLDPPYEQSTNKYKLGKFYSSEFYDWAYEISKQNTVIISSYEVSDKRFEPVFEFKSARSSLSAQGKGNRYEKLFMVKS